MALACCGLAACGCAMPDMRGKGFEDGTADWSQNLRPTTESGRLSGIDGRSREIERNLGIR